MNPIQSTLENYKTIILDGALATELETHGCDLDDPLWSARVLIEQPELIQKIHKEYFEKGADVAITASYQATVEGFASRGIREEEALTLIRKTVSLAKQARDDYWVEHESSARPKPLVAGSVGPYGAYLADGSEYTGHYEMTQEELKAFHRPRIEALIEAGADLLAIETIPSFQEAQGLSELLKEYPGTYAWISFTLKNGQEISDGTGLKEVAETLEKIEQIAAIGINCSPAEYATEAVKVLHQHTDKPIVIYPNFGETYNAETNTWSGESTATNFDQLSELWYQSGARVIGGCCRTTPEQIKALSLKWR
ncbi:homocysteine S-methyltransferase [Halobacillus fulvus]|nr:homocysteine S-methyltransferase [Halobacillus fulvus]